jgi:hypothetical protein
VGTLICQDGNNPCGVALFVNVSFATTGDRSARFESNGWKFMFCNYCGVRNRDTGFEPGQRSEDLNGLPDGLERMHPARRPQYRIARR